MTTTLPLTRDKLWKTSGYRIWFPCLEDIEGKIKHGIIHRCSFFVILSSLSRAKTSPTVMHAVSSVLPCLILPPGKSDLLCSVAFIIDSSPEKEHSLACYKQKAEHALDSFQKWQQPSTHKEMQSIKLIDCKREDTSVLIEWKHPPQSKEISGSSSFFGGETVLHFFVLVK